MKSLQNQKGPLQATYTAWAAVKPKPSKITRLAYDAMLPPP